MSLQNFILPAETWVNVNTLTGIAVGVTMVISNLGKSEIRIIQSLDEPVEILGDIITTNSKPYARATVGGDDAVWLYTAFPCEIAVQVDV